MKLYYIYRHLHCFYDDHQFVLSTTHSISPHYKLSRDCNFSWKLVVLGENSFYLTDCDGYHEFIGRHKLKQLFSCERINFHIKRAASTEEKSTNKKFCYRSVCVSIFFIWVYVVHCYSICEHIHFIVQRKK